MQLNKIQRLSDCMKKHILTICCFQETNFPYEDTNRLKGWTKM